MEEEHAQESRGRRKPLRRGPLLKAQKDVGSQARIIVGSQESISSIKRDVKKKVLPRPEGEKILSRDPAHFTVRVPLDLRERFCF